MLTPLIELRGTFNFKKVVKHTKQFSEWIQIRTLPCDPIQKRESLNLDCCLAKNSSIFTLILLEYTVRVSCLMYQSIKDLDFLFCILKHFFHSNH